MILERDIIDTIKKDNPSISDTDTKWRLFNYCKKNSLKCIGSQMYVSADEIYTYKLGEVAENIRELLSDNFPEIKFDIWESHILNEWLNLLLARNTIFVEVERGFEETFYDTLMDFNEDIMILVNPKIDDYFRYQKNGIIVIRTMIGRAPLTKENHITIEKLIVDLLCDKLLTAMIDEQEIENIIAGATGKYAINEKRIMAYAKRRGRFEYVLNRWRSLND